MKSVSSARFRLYTLGSARPPGLPGEIRAVWESDAEDRLALVTAGRDGAGYLLLFARDLAGRFAPAGNCRTFASERAACDAVAGALAGPVGATAGPTYPGLDLLTPVAPPTAQHPYFRQICAVPHSAPARRVLREIGPWLGPTDPHFVREFQTGGFDQRLWEIFLWACFREAGLRVEQPEHPDFILARAAQRIFSVEATTVAASQGGVLADHPDPNTVKEMAAFLRDFMPIKYGNALTGKLNKRIGKRAYWELPDTEGLPFLIAVADFHVAASGREPGSMVYSQSGLPIYLYGTEFSAEHNAKGELEIGYQKRQGHAYKAKKIESGFFDLPGAENVAGVLFCNAGTISKFTRMGVVAGFGGADFTYIRKGFIFDPDPNAAIGREVTVLVTDANYREGWGDELQLFHNPHAVRPFDPSLLPDATHHRWEDDGIVSYERPGRFTTSITHNIHATADPAGEATRLKALF